MSEASSTLACPSSPELMKGKRDDVDVDVEDCSSPLNSDLLPQNTTPSFTPLPSAVLLISLPKLLIHPPNHRFHAHSLCISLLALRRCLQMPGLSPDIECRAWTAIVEIGMIALEGGFSLDEDHIWARNLEKEVEEAQSRGLLIAQKHPSLRSYRSQLTFLAAQLALWQRNVKFARTLLRRLLSSFVPSDPPHLVYTAHLKHISSLMVPSSPSPFSSSLPISPGYRHPQDTRAVLTAIQNMQNIAIKSNHSHVTLLTRVLRLRLLMSSGQLVQVEEALSSAEEGLGIEYPAERSQKQPDSPSRGGLRVADINTSHLPSLSPFKLNRLNENHSLSSSADKASVQAVPSYKTFSDPFSTSMALHTLIIGVVFYTYAGSAVDSSQRLSHLHALLDSGVLKFPSAEDPCRASGIIEIPFPNQLPMYIQTTHPRILYVLAYLVSAVAKKDPVGRKPKRKIFATEGLSAWERELKRELKLPAWATVGDVEEIDIKMAKIKGDLMCELIGVSIMRSELDAADKTLSLLIAHLRTHGLFESFAARVTLHHAHLAHTRGDLKRAMQCYQVAAHVAEERGDDFVRLSARAGLVAFRIGIFRTRQMMGQPDSDAMQVDVEDGDDDDCSWEEVERMGLEVVESCKGMGGTLSSIGRVIEACLTDEILKAKQDLRSALNFTSSGGDNHIRALILALIASQFFHTSADDALNMLAMCENLAAGLGAGAGKVAKGEEKKVVDDIGNAPLRVWVGERTLELHRRTKNTRAARKQEAANAALQKAIANTRSSASYTHTATSVAADCS
ncbi:hypothetical protein E1B28_001999 [Marasmius oreades]|uniref:Uncharacterized protein n=1 Tax=Marasmius oreades TaxID=181124 RepID=A0A9P7V4J0_9AGAR|nr:uncharacterized protein E1B28_001999 [Marasmius oreades]KAG7100224.1 hypothetical protein E1B28_001999 [Marasmius oreades]